MKKVAKVAVFLLSLVPLGYFVWGALTDHLGPNPIEAITRGTGDWTLRFLLITLAITPARKLLGRPELIRYRRMLGLFAFFYGFLHLVTWVWLDKFFDLGEMWKDVAKRKFITIGMLAFVAMVPLAITSTAGWIRRMGGRRWQALHRLIYLSVIGGVIHYWWLVKSDIRSPATYGVIAAVLLGLRLVVQNRKPQPRAAVAARTL